MILNNHTPISTINDSHSSSVEYDVTNVAVTISSIPYMAEDKIKAKIHDAINNGDVLATFLVIDINFCQ
jgi:hypothetical protein